MMYMLPQALVGSMAYEFIESENRFIHFLLAMLYWSLLLSRHIEDGALSGG